MDNLSDWRAAGYEPVERLAGGGLADVFLAYRLEDQSQVVLKVARPDADEAAKQRLHTERHLLQAIDHPNVIRALDGGELAGLPFLVLEYFPAQSLRERMEGPLPWEVTSTIVQQVAAALTALHAMEILHRDIKPENVLINDDGRVKLIDLSIGAEVSQLGVQTAHGEFVGTVEYMAPEQRHRLHVDHRADQYSLAAMAFEMLTGSFPLGQFRRPSEIKPCLSDAIDRILLKGLQTDADDRYPNVRAFADELASELLASPPRPKTTIGHWVGLVIAAASVGLLIFAASTRGNSAVESESDSSNVVIVDTVDDLVDGNTKSLAKLRANPGLDGKISLREAIRAANATYNVDAATPDEIHFQIPDPLKQGAHTIYVRKGGLPQITEAVIIDGTTDADFAGAPILELNGKGAGTADGLRLAKGSSGSVIRGLVINRFSSSGIEISSDNNVVVGNYIGTDPRGTMAAGNIEGVHISEGSNNRVGGEEERDANVISGNHEEGVEVRQLSSVGNRVVGNRIGVGTDGANLGNRYGVLLWNAGHSLVGGTEEGAGNLIAHNDVNGVLMIGEATGHSVLGNQIHSNGKVGFNRQGIDPPPQPIGTSADSPSNGTQGAPVIRYAGLDGAELILQGTLEASSSLAQYRLEFFSTPIGIREVGRAEGRLYLGSTKLTTRADGTGEFQLVLPRPSALGESDYITATATRIEQPEHVGHDDRLAYGATSEFGERFALRAPQARLIR